ncbi:hypothetical protein [Streptomyces niveus]|uniref:hypothetical protein n=1 Tax=Streptomyces niveus TaxID=193462 RepID=UPI003426E80F
MSTTQLLRTQLLDQGFAALRRTETERQYLDPDFQLLAYTSMTANLAVISNRLLDALSWHSPELAQRLAEEILDLQDEPQEMTEYLRAQATTASVRGTTASVTSSAA